MTFCLPASTATVLSPGDRPGRVISPGWRLAQPKSRTSCCCKCQSGVPITTSRAYRTRRAETGYLFSSEASLDGGTETSPRQPYPGCLSKPMVR